MRSRLLPVLAFAAVAPASGPVLAADAQHPSVIELFQSQGCSSCPPANANLIELSRRPDILALSFGVTYWDQLGWKDTFASPQFTARQWDYARAFGRSEVFTPEVVVNGKADVVGSNRAELEALIGREAANNGPEISYEHGVIGVGAGEGTGEVWLVRYDPNIVQVPIARGENGGRTLPHKNVVKQLVKLGYWSGHASRFATPSSPNAGWDSAVIVERGPGGAIVAAGKLQS